MNVESSSDQSWGGFEELFRRQMWAEIVQICSSAPDETRDYCELEGQTSEI